MFEEWATPLDRCRFVNDGDAIDAGDRRLVALRPPVFDNPTTRGLFGERTGVLWSVDLSRDWIVVGSLEARRLHGDPARSPLAQRVSNHYASAGLAYRF